MAGPMVVDGLDRRRCLFALLRWWHTSPETIDDFEALSRTEIFETASRMAEAWGMQEELGQISEMCSAIWKSRPSGRAGH
jgi:hypothetical protein